MEYSKREKKIKFGDVTPGHVVRDDDGAMFMKLKANIFNVYNNDIGPIYYNAADLADGSLHSFDDDFKVEDVPGGFVEYGVDRDFADNYTKTPSAIISTDKKYWIPEWFVDYPTVTGAKAVNTTIYPQFNVDSYEGEANNDSPVIKDCWSDIVGSWKTGKGKTKLHE